MRIFLQKHGDKYTLTDTTGILKFFLKLFGQLKEKRINLTYRSRFNSRCLKS